MSAGRSTVRPSTGAGDGAGAGGRGEAGAGGLAPDSAWPKTCVTSALAALAALQLHGAGRGGGHMAAHGHIVAHGGRRAPKARPMVRGGCVALCVCPIHRGGKSPAPDLDLLAALLPLVRTARVRSVLDRLELGVGKLEKVLGLDLDVEREPVPFGRRAGLRQLDREIAKRGDNAELGARHRHDFVEMEA
eukprot:1258882-Prymnesium_polylepis.1